MTDTEQDIHDDIERAVETADISKIRISLIKCLKLDANRKFYYLNQKVSEIGSSTKNRYKFFNGELDYAACKAEGIIDEHDGETFRPMYGWNFGYLKSELSRLTKNFSMQRIELVKKMLLVGVFLRRLQTFISYLLFFTFGSWTYSLFKQQDFSLDKTIVSALGAWCLWVIIDADNARKKEK